MTTTFILSAVMAIIQIVAFILLIVVLIKQFKHGGVLHGIIGIVTCGFWTFIWGWLKHKPLRLTQTMVLWTILIVSPMVLTAVFGFAMISEMAKIVTHLTDQGLLIQMTGSFDKKSGPNGTQQQISVNLPKRSQNKSRATDADKGVDWGQKALALWQDGKYTDAAEALDLWNKAIQKDPKSAEAYNNRGLAHYHLKKYPQAIKDYSQAIRLKPDYAIAYNNRANTYYELNQFELAQADYNQGIGFKPDYAKAYLNRGLVNYQLGENTQACLDLKKACDLGDCEGLRWASQNTVCQ